MANIYKSFSKATVCKGNTCVTVYGDAAIAIEVIVVTTVTILAVALLANALK
jgi:hypothetical protein